MKKKTLILSAFIIAAFLILPLCADAAAQTKKYTGKVLYRSGDYLKIKIGSTTYKVETEGAKFYTSNNSTANINHFERGDRVTVTGKYRSSEKILYASKVKNLSRSKRPNALRATVKSFNKETNTITAKKDGTTYTINYNDTTIFLTKKKKKSTESELRINKSFYFYGKLTGTKMINVSQIYRRND